PPAPRCLPPFPTRRSSDLDFRIELGGIAFVDDQQLRLVDFPQTAADFLVERRDPRRSFDNEHDDVSLLDGDANLCIDFLGQFTQDRKSTRLNSSHVSISYA